MTPQEAGRAAAANAPRITRDQAIAAARILAAGAR